MTKRRVNLKPGVPRPGTVEGTQVPDVLLDTGCSRSLVRRDLVPAEKILEGEGVRSWRHRLVSPSEGAGPD